MESHERTTEEIELHSELSREVAIDHAEHLVRREYVLGVILEVKDAHYAGVRDLPDLGVGTVTLIGERNVKLVVENGIVEDFNPFAVLLWLIIKNDGGKIFGGTLIDITKRCDSGIDLLRRRHHF